MAILEVLHYPDKRLRNKALIVVEVDNRCRQLAKDMLATMYQNDGIGLAATQVNVALRVVVIDLSEDKKQPLCLINPEVLSSQGTVESQEGCLSVPGYYEKVVRAETITYRHQDLRGKTHTRETDGLLAICIQHEIDHLNGKLFIDHLSPMKQKRFRKKLQKQKKIQASVL